MIKTLNFSRNTSKIMTVLAHSFDVETSSPTIGEGKLMSIGACVLEIPNNGTVEVIDTFCENIDWEGGLVFDHPKTEQFWKDNPDAFATCTKEVSPPSVVAGRLRDHIRAVQEIANKRKAKYVIVVDNAWFDVPWIDWFLSSFSAEALPLRHNYLTGWMSVENVVDVNQRIRALRDIGLRVNVPPDIVEGAEHTPLTDAKCIAHKFAFYSRWSRGKRAELRK